MVNYMRFHISWRVKSDDSRDTGIIVVTLIGFFSYGKIKTLSWLSFINVEIFEFIGLFQWELRDLIV